MNDEDDFEDTFGLSVPDTAQAEERRDETKQDALEDEEDIYGDILGSFDADPAAQTAQEATPGASMPVLHDAEQRALTTERQNSGQLAESRTPSAPRAGLANAGGTAGLPKKLADTTVVYVGELHWWTTEADVERICTEFGPVDSLMFFEDKGNGKSKGYALVKFSNKEAANVCRQQMNGMEVNGRKCVVTFSSNSHAATKMGARQDMRQQSAVNGTAPGRGQHYGPQSSGMPGRGRGRGGGWGMAPAEPAMPMPPIVPWGPGMPMMGMGMPMGGLPMPGMGMPFPMPGMMGGRGQGNDGERDFKRQRF